MNYHRFTHKVANSRVVENIFPEKQAMIYENQIIVKKMVRSDSKEKFYYKKDY